MHNIQERLGIACALVVALALIGTATASAAVTVSSFGAIGGQGQINLSWTTETELRNFGFNVDRSADQVNWKHVTFVPSQSPCFSSMTRNIYSYTDNSSDLVVTGTYSYRLQLVGSACSRNEPDQYYDRTVSASPNGGKGPAQPTPTPTAVPPTATPTAVPPTATPTAIPPMATPTAVPQATSTNTPLPQNTPVPTSTPVPTNTTVPLPARTVPAGAPRFTPTATLAPGAQQPTAAPVAMQTPSGGEQPPSATSTDAPPADGATASPAPTDLALVVATEASSAQIPQGARRPVQSQPTPAPAAGGSLLVGVGLLGVLGMGAAGFLLLGLAGVVLWRFYARG